MNQPQISSELMVFLFTDLVDSTGWKQALGDIAYATDILQPHNDLFRKLLLEFPEAVERNFTGDGFLVTFTGPSAAVQFALRFHEKLQECSWSATVTRAGRLPETRIGIHLGEAIEYADADPERSQVTGQVVDLAARIMGLASGRQTLLTRPAFDNARQYVRQDGLSWLAHGQYRCKGCDDPLEVCEVGVPGRAPLAPPPDSDKAKRVKVEVEDDTGSWRPAVGLPIPRRDGWAIERKLGEGGFGEVWLARHARTKERRVFKFCFDAERLRSFKRELTFFKLIKNELGERPDIAKLHEVQIDAPPYFLESEFVESGNLAQWAEAQGGLEKAPFATRLRLMVETARAVAAAHSLGIIHKDLKPSNVLIKLDRDGTPHAQLNDFGIGVLADRSLLQRGAITETGFTESVMFGNDSSRTGTRLYSPPEASLGKPATTGFDVYALGVMLFQVVIGDLQRPLGTGWQEAVTAEAAGDPIQAGLLLDDITAATHGQPGQRLPGAAILEERLANLEARRTKRLAQIAQREAEQLGLERDRRLKRLRWLLAIGCAILLLVGTLGIYAWQAKNRADDEARNAKEQRQIAEHREAGARAIAKFYENNVLAVARPSGWAGGAGKDVTLKEALDLAVPAIDAAFAGQPELEAAVRHTLGVTYYYLGQFDNTHLEKALAIRVEVLGPDHPDALASLHELAMLRWKQSELQEAIPLARQALEKRRRVLGPEHEDTLYTQLNLGLFLSEDGQPDEAETLLRDAIEACKRTLGSDHHHTLYGQNDLAIVLNNKGKYEEALALDRDTLEGRRRTLGPEHPDTLRSIANLACSLWNMDKLEEAEKICRQGLEARKRVLGEAHVETFWSLRNLAGILEDRGKVADSEALRRQMLKDGERLRGPNDAETLTNIAILGKHLNRHGKLEEAEQLFRRLIDANRRKFGNEHYNTLYSLGNLANALDEQGKWPETAELNREILAIQERVRGSDHEDTLTTRNNLASALFKMGKKNEAEAIYRRIVEAWNRARGPDHPRTLVSQEYLADCLNDLGKWVEAANLYRSSLAAHQRLFGPEDLSTLRTQHDLANVLEFQGVHSEAEKLHRQTLETRQRVVGAENPVTLVSQNSLASALQDQGKWEEAEKLFRHTVEVGQRVFGHEDSSTLTYQTNLAILLGDRDKSQEAEKLFRMTLETCKRLNGSERPRTLDTMEYFAIFLEEHGQTDEAEKLLSRILAARRKLLPADHPDTATTLVLMGRLLARIGRPADAIPLVREGLTIREKTLPPSYWQLAAARSVMGSCLCGQNQYDEAESLLIGSYQALIKAPNTPIKQLANAIDRIILLYEKWNKQEKAEEWRKKKPKQDK